MSYYNIILKGRLPINLNSQSLQLNKSDSANVLTLNQHYLNYINVHFYVDYAFRSMLKAMLTTGGSYKLNPLQATYKYIPRINNVINHNKRLSRTLWKLLLRLHYYYPTPLITLSIALVILDVKQGIKSHVLRI